MDGQSSYCPKPGQLGGPGGLHNSEELPKRQELQREARLRIADLTSRLPAIQLRLANDDEVRFHQKVTRNLMRSMIEEMNHAIDAYADVECNEQEIKQLSEEGDQAISYVTD